MTRFLTILVAPVAVLIMAGSWWLLDQRDAPLMVVPQASNMVLEPCVESASQLLNNAPVVLDEELLLASNNLIRWLNCSPGILEFQARGSLFNNYGPLVTVAVGTETLWTGEVREEAMSFYLEVPAGWLTIAFTNDAYAPLQDRNVWLSEISFTKKSE